VPEISSPVVPVRITYRCDECGMGGMVPTGERTKTYPSLYIHECHLCKNQTNLKWVCPEVIFVTPEEAEQRLQQKV